MSSMQTSHSLVPRPLPWLSHCFQCLRVTLKTWEWPGDEARGVRYIIASYNSNYNILKICMKTSRFLYISLTGHSWAGNYGSMQLYSWCLRQPIANQAEYFYRHNGPLILLCAHGCYKVYKRIQSVQYVNIILLPFSFRHISTRPWILIGSG